MRGPPAPRTRDGRSSGALASPNAPKPWVRRAVSSGLLVDVRWQVDRIVAEVGGALGKTFGERARQAGEHHRRLQLLAAFETAREQHAEQRRVARGTFLER